MSKESLPISQQLLPDNVSLSGKGELLIGGCRVDQLIDKYQTPLFIYDEDHIRRRCQEIKTYFGDGASYATKAFSCRFLNRIINQEGLKFDVSTLGEMHAVLEADVDPSNLIVHGNNKSFAELTLAVERGVHRIVVDSFDELDRLRDVFNQTGRTADILLRVSPGVEAHTHEYTTTGTDDNKFGFTVSTGLADQAIKQAQKSPAVNLLGLHAHIGSQVLDVDCFKQAASVVIEFAKRYQIDELSLGGGLGVSYTAHDRSPSIADWSHSIRVAAQELGFDRPISVEPGRSIVAQAAITVYQVGTIKELPGLRTYVSVDGGMSDNPRPSLYQSVYEAFLPRAVRSPREQQVRLVGKHCESGDILIREAWLPSDLAVGDLVAIPVTGAYHYAMSSNYNRLPKPAVVFVKDGQSQLAIRRQTYQDLSSCEL